MAIFITSINKAPIVLKPMMRKWMEGVENRKICQEKPDSIVLGLWNMRLIANEVG